MLLEDETTCDCAWKLKPHEKGTGTNVLEDGVVLDDGAIAFPATWDNLLRLKNAVQEHDPDSTIFPTAGSQPRARHPRHRRAFHDAALAGGRVGDERAQSRHHRQSEQHSARAGLRRRRDARRAARHGAVSVHRNERARGASGTKRRRHEPRLRALEAQDRVSPAAASPGASTPTISRSAASSTRARTRSCAAACSPATSRSICRRSSRRRRRRRTRPPG